MSQPILVVIIIVALAGAAYLVFLHRRTSKLSTAVANVPSLLTTAVTDLKSHFSAVSAGAETRLVRLIARTPAEPSKVAAPAAPAKAIPVVGTTGDLITAKVPQPDGTILTITAPAAPAAPVAVEPPPATVAPAAPPAVPAPSAEGSGTEHSLTIEPRAPIPDSTGPVPVASLSLADLRFLWWATINPATPKMHNWEYTVLSGTRLQIQEDLATVGLNVSWLRGFQPDAYHGILRNYYDEALKA